MNNTNLTSQIIKATIEEYFNDHIKNIEYTKNIGYTVSDSIYSYAEKIGTLLKQNDLEFTSLFDKGMTAHLSNQDNMSSKEKSSALEYIQRCKSIPTSDFLNKALDKQFQIDILLDTISLFDFTTCRKNETENLSMINILKDYKVLGINSLLINTKLTEAAHKESFRDSIHPAIFVNYIDNGFYFTDSVLKDMKTDYGHNYKMTPELIKHIDDFFNKNKINKSSSIYDNLDYILPHSPVKKTPKI